MKKSTRKTLLIIISILIIAPLLFFGILSLKVSPGYAWRIMTLFSSDVNDYKVFDNREMALSESPLILDRVEGFYVDEITYPYDGGEKTETFDSLLERTQTNAFIVIQNDQIVFESYPHADPQAINTSFSVAKSFDSALIGAAIADGYIGSVDDLVIDYLPELTGRGLDELTIRNLLRMDSGICYHGEDEVLAPFSDDALTYYPPDLREIALSVEACDTPFGKDFHYNNFHPLLEGLILERATGMHVADYLAQRIWQPMGAEFEASWSIDSEKSGFEKMESGINARAIDFAKFGLLYLHHGFLNGRQILPEEWIDQSVQPDPTDQRNFIQYPQWKEAGGYYGFHWWGMVNEDGSYDFMARGHLGQIIYVAPRANMVVVRFGPEPDDHILWADVINALVDQL